MHRRTYGGTAPARTRELKQLEDDLQTLRAEARSGYGKEEVRRNCIKADLVAQRKARERAAATLHQQQQQQQQKEAQDEAPRPSTSSAAVGTVSIDNAAPSLLSFLDALWPEGAAQDQERETELGEEDATAASVVAQSHTLQSQLYPQLQEAAADYAFDAGVAMRLGAVREWDARSGLPQAWVTQTASSAPTHPGVSNAAWTSRADPLTSMLAQAAATTEAAEERLAATAAIKPSVMNASRPATGVSQGPMPSTVAVPVPRPPPPLALAHQGASVELTTENLYNPERAATVTTSQREVRVPGHRTVPRSSVSVQPVNQRPTSSASSAVSYSTNTPARGDTAAPHKAHGSTKGNGSHRSGSGLSTQGTAVAVNFAAGYTRDLQKQIARERHEARLRQQQLAALQAALVAGAEQAGHAPPPRRAVTIIREYMDAATRAEDEDALLTRVRQPVVLLFCPSCHHSLTHDLALSLMNGGHGSGDASHAVVCPHCTHSVPLPSLQDGLLPPLRPAPDEDGEDRDGSTDAGPDTRMGTDAVGFPADGPDGATDNGEGDDGSFAAAVAAVRRAMAAERAAASSTTTTLPARATAVGVGTADEGIKTTVRATGTGSAAWEQALCGVYFQHLWDAAHGLTGAPLPLRNGMSE